MRKENYPRPGFREVDEEGIIRGGYIFKSTDKGEHRVQLMGSGTILREVLAAQDLLLEDWGIGSDVWSVTSFTELRRDGLDCERHALLHPEDSNPPKPYITKQLEGTEGPIVVSTDYMKAYGDQIRPFIPEGRRLHVLGADGFGRSDFRSKLRSHFEIDRYFVVLASLRALADEGRISRDVCIKAIEKYGIDQNKANPHHA